YYDNRQPVGPHTYASILEHRLEALLQTLGAEHEHVLELHSILTALNYLPPPDETTAEKKEERNREKEIIKRRIAALAAACPQFRARMGATFQGFNGKGANPGRFDLLARLLERQPFRPASWRVATEEINYRRFFDINELAAIHMEDPEVFRATHQLIFRLLA